MKDVIPETGSNAPRLGWHSILSGNVLALGLVSLFTDLSSEMIYPLLPLFIAGMAPTPASSAHPFCHVATLPAHHLALTHKPKDYNLPPYVSACVLPGIVSGWAWPEGDRR